MNWNNNFRYFKFSLAKITSRQPLLALILLLGVANAFDCFSQTTIQIGNGTTSTSSKYPFEGYYDYSWSNIIYKASEINRPGTITKVAFNVKNSPVNYTMTNQKIFARHTSNSSYSNANYPSNNGYILVFDGSITYNGTGWKELVLTTPFEYNGIDNIEFLFENRDGSYQSGFPTFEVTSGLGEYRIRRDYKDYAFPVTCTYCASINAVLNIRLTISDCSFNGGTIQANSNLIIPGSSTNLTITGPLSNSQFQWQVSSDNINYSNISGAVQNSYTTPSLTSRKYYRNLVSYNGCSKLTNVVTIDIDTSSLVTASIGNGVSQFDKVPVSAFYDFSWSSLIYKSNEINSSGKLSHLSFFADNAPNNIVLNNQKIYARHTSLNEFPDATYPDHSNFTLIYEGSLIYNGTGWNEIALTNLFEYNGIDNLELLFVNNDGSYTLEFPIFRGEANQSEFRVKRDYKDGTFPLNCTYCNRFKNRVNIKMKFLPCNFPAGSVTANKNTVQLGEQYNLILTGQNNTASLQWQKSVDNTTYMNIAGANSPSLVQTMNAPSWYRVIVFEGCSKFTNSLKIDSDTCFTKTANIGDSLISIEKYPFNLYYDNSWSNVLYKAQELGGAGKITSIAFFVSNNPQNFTATNQKIYVRHTNAIGYTNNVYSGTSGFTLIFDGSITYNGSGWKEIYLTNYFDYNGTENLEFLFENRHGAWCSNYPTFRYSSGMDSFRVKRDYKDGSFPESCYLCNKFQNIPNIKIRRQLPLPSAGSNVTICKGETVELNATGGDTYFWTPSTGLNNPNIANPLASPNSTITYTVNATRQNMSCQANVTVFVDSLCNLVEINTLSLDTIINGDTLMYTIIAKNVIETHKSGSIKYIKMDQPAVGNLIDVEMKFFTYSAGEFFNIKYNLDRNFTISNLRTGYSMDVPVSESLARIIGNKLTFVSGFTKIKTVSNTSFVGNDLNLNWKHEIVKDENGNIISDHKVYYDFLGRQWQSLSKNLASNEVLASQIVYDDYGRPAIQTLPAPVGNAMQFKNGFVKSSNSNIFSWVNFDNEAKLNNPDPVKNNEINTLGYYYSDNGESYVAASSFPYIRTEYSSDPYSAVKRMAKAGESYKMGSGHEQRGFVIDCNGELASVLGSSKHWKTRNTSDPLYSNSVSTNKKLTASKSINIDENGKTIITYSQDGLVIATCYSGLAVSCPVRIQEAIMNQKGTRSVDIHLPAAYKSSLKLPLPVYYLRQEEEYQSSEPQTSGSGSPFGSTTSSNSVQSESERIVWASSVTITENDIIYKITDLETNRLLVLGSDYTINSSNRSVTFLGNYASGQSFLRISFNFTASFLNNFNYAYYDLPNPKVNYTLDYSNWTVNLYDFAGRVKQIIPGEGVNCLNPGVFTMATVFDYNSFGQLIGSVTPDEGKTEAVYDSEGKLRFSQNAEQRLQNKFSYINYDKNGRSVESGIYTSVTGGVYFQNYYGNLTIASGNTSSSSIINSLDDLNDVQCSEQVFISYNSLPEVGQIPASHNNYRQRYLNGSVSKTRNQESITWYSYDQFGRVSFSIQQITDNDFPLTGRMKTHDYSYKKLTGLITDEVYQKNTTEEFKHAYLYNANGQLIKAEALSMGTNVAVAEFNYYKTGALKRKELGNLQGIDYVYTVNGNLKSMNHPVLNGSDDPGKDGVSGTANSAFYPDLFGMTIDYHQGDYTRSGTNIVSSVSAGSGFFNGLIDAVRFKTNKNYASGADKINGTISLISNNATQQLMNRFTYDDQYQLSTSTFGVYNGNFTPRNDFKVYGNSATGGINYDKNGNIKNLKRNGFDGQFGLLMDDINYSYLSGTNQLERVNDIATNSYTSDFKTGASSSFVYDAVGKLSKSESEGVYNIEYASNGKVKKVIFDLVTGQTQRNYTEYFYNDRGIKQKVKYVNPTSGTNKTTWYVYGISGNITATYEKESTGSIQLTENPVYLGARAGVYKPLNNKTTYEIADHLGNVRVTFKQGTTNLEVTSWSDYYPHGGVMPGRHWKSEDYRYNYQGQEKAAEQKWVNFDLRMYNADLGRFTTPDPFSQFHSSYLAMANNPVSFIDPSGGLSFSASQSIDLNEGNAYNYYMEFGYASALDMAMSQLGLGGPNSSLDGGVSGSGLSFQQLAEFRYDSWWIKSHDSKAEGPKIYKDFYNYGTNVDGTPRNLGQDYSDISRANKAWAATKAYRLKNGLSLYPVISGLKEMPIQLFKASRRKYKLEGTFWGGIWGNRIILEGAQSGGGDGDNWLSNAGTAIGMGMMWATGCRLPFGAGSNYNNDAVAGAMRNAYGVGQARDAFYAKYKGATDLSGASYTNHRAGFGLSGLVRAGIDPIEQFIGNYRVDIYPQGNMLQFTLTNNSSFTSFFYGFGPSWNGGPMGNFNQTYIFTEPLNMNKLK